MNTSSLDNDLSISMENGKLFPQRHANLQVCCIIPTYKGRHEVEKLLASFSFQSLECDIFIVDSGSGDGTLEFAKERVSRAISISSAEFNHGGTRQMMIHTNPGYNVYIFLTQDAYLANPHAIERIVAPFSDARVGAVCGRQLPHLDANPLSQHARRFNYPNGQKVRSIEDVPSLGLKAAFISNSFAAYRATALEEVGGFPSNVIFAEDMYVAAKMLLGGWKIAYAGDAQCYHSHNYTLGEEFRRYFDMGVFHTRESWIRDKFGGAGGEGMRYVKSELKFLGLKRLHLWPASILRNFVKLVGYKLGQQERRLPQFLKRKCGMHKRYWDGPHAFATPVSK